MMNRASPDRPINRLGIKVHRKLGPGLLNGSTRNVFAGNSRMVVLHPRNLAVVYEDIHLNCGLYADIIVEQEAVLELKSVERILPVHEAQTLTYLRLSGYRVGF